MRKEPEADESNGCYSYKEWCAENKIAKWATKDVLGDGMCGWVSIMLQIGVLTLDDITFWTKNPWGLHLKDGGKFWTS